MFGLGKLKNPIQLEMEMNKGLMFKKFAFSTTPGIFGKILLEGSPIEAPDGAEIYGILFSGGKFKRAKVIDFAPEIYFRVVADGELFEHYFIGTDSNEEYYQEDFYKFLSETQSFIQNNFLVAAYGDSNAARKVIESFKA